MEENNQARDQKDQEIIYSRSIKAGKRIYYLDVKRNRKGELYLAITESKKVVNGFDENAQVTYEKHKIFLYREDFEKFEDGINDVMSFIRREEPASEKHYEYKSERVGSENKNEAAESRPSDSSLDFKIDEFEG